MKVGWRSGRAWVWLTAGAVSLSLLAMVALLALLVSQSLQLLWQQPIYRFTLSGSPGVLLGVRAEVQRPPGPAAGEIWFINTGNRPLRFAPAGYRPMCWWSNVVAAHSFMAILLECARTDNRSPPQRCPLRWINGCG